MILGILLFVVTLYSCSPGTKSEEVFFMEMDASETGKDSDEAIKGAWDSLSNTTGITIEHAFKVVGQQRIVAVVSAAHVCNTRSLELELAKLNLRTTAKELYDALDLAEDLGIDNETIANAEDKRPSTLNGDHIYFALSNLATDVEDESAFEEILRTDFERTLAYHTSGAQFMNYNVLGEFPMQMVTFGAWLPEEVQNDVWMEVSKDIFKASSILRVVNLEDFVADNYCK